MSEVRNRQISYDITNMWNLKKQKRYRQIFYKTGVTDLENKHYYQVIRRGGMNWDIGTNIYTLICIKYITN